MTGNLQFAWSAVVDGLGIDLTAELSDEIPAGSFRKLADTEARIACKIDSSLFLPPVLKSRGLFPLPVRNGVYRLVRGKGFHEFEPIDGPAKRYVSRVGFHLTTRSGIGESVYVHHAYNSGLLSEFSGIDNLIKTNEGRFYSRGFSFMVGNVGPIHQVSTQIQVDGLFESEEQVVIVEAKTRSLPDFIIRQLYYPYRHWSVEGKKPVRTVFLEVNLDSNVYNFWQYHFRNPDDYSSIEIERKAKYTVIENLRGRADLEAVSADEQMKYVPQADSVDRIVLLPFLVSEGVKNGHSLSRRMGFTTRQAAYYSEAAEALGLIERRRSTGAAYEFVLTNLGERYVASRPDVRNSIISQQMMRLPAMRIVFDQLIEVSFGSPNVKRYLTKAEIAGLIKEKSGFTGSTPRRRAASILSWFQWIGENYGVVDVSLKRLSIQKSIQSKLSE